MHLRGRNGVELTLHVLAYQFPDLEQGDWHDLNWLAVEGEVISPEGSWTFLDPCMLTTEAERLTRWLREAANGEVPATPPDGSGNVHSDLGFVEPNLAFGVERRGGGEVTLRLHFSLESAPPWSGDEHRVVSDQFFVPCSLSEDALREAAAAWHAALADFPERGTRTW